MNPMQHTRRLLRSRNCMEDFSERNYLLDFQERVQHLERQLKEMENEKERELSALRKEKRELVHTSQMVRWIYDTVVITITFILSNMSTTLLIRVVLFAE